MTDLVQGTTEAPEERSGHPGAEYAVRQIEYDFDLENGNIVLPAGAPFDGSPVLIKLAAGWCEAWWAPSERHETQDGTEYDGFHWVCVDDQFHAEIDDAKFWTALPIEPTPTCDECGQNPADLPSLRCVGCDAYRDHTGHF